MAPSVREPNLPQSIAAGIDKIAGWKHRTRFIVEVLATELQRCEQLAALEEAAGAGRTRINPTGERIGSIP
jgi:hypothetical protein